MTNYRVALVVDGSAEDFGRCYFDLMSNIAGADQLSVAVGRLPNDIEAREFVLGELTNMSNNVSFSAAHAVFTAGMTEYLAPVLKEAMESNRPGAVWAVYQMAQQAGRSLLECVPTLKQSWERIPEREMAYAPLALVALGEGLDERALRLLTSTVETKPYILDSLARLVLAGSPAPQAVPLALQSLESENRDRCMYGWKLVGALAAQGMEVAAAVANLKSAIAKRDPLMRESVLFAARYLHEEGVDIREAANSIQKAKGPPKDGYWRLSCQLAVTLRTRLWPLKETALRQLVPELVGMMNNEDRWEIFRKDAREALVRLAASGAADRSLIRQNLPESLDRLVGLQHITAVRDACQEET